MECPIIYQYTRADALRDRYLNDVSKLAAEAGIRYPTAVTAGVWSRCVAVPADVPWQDEEGRLWDVLSVLTAAMRRSSGGSRVDFSVTLQGRHGKAENVRLYALCHPGDQGEPVITVMLPEED